MRRGRASMYIMLATAVTVAVLFFLPITPKVAVRTAKVERGMLLKRVPVSGAVGYSAETPYAALVSGVVESVLVSQGDFVKKGQLLVTMDAEAEKAALADIMRLEGKRSEALGTGLQGDIIAASTMQGSIALYEKAAELRAAIGLKSLRALSDGVVEQVYAREGCIAPSGAALLMTRGEGLEITATLRLQDARRLRVGARAMLSRDGVSLGLSEIRAFEAPALDAAGGQMVQRVRFSCPEELRSLAGQTVDVEAIESANFDVPLLPVAAVTDSDTVWVVRDGRAYTAAIDAGVWDGGYALAPETLLGMSVVLSPDESKLFEGCHVKERAK